jgi:hypothetical protein
VISSYAGLKIAKGFNLECDSTADATAVAIDRKGYQDCLICCYLGTGLTELSGSVYWTVTFEECDTTTAGSFTHIADADLEGGAHTVVINDPTEDNQILVRNYIGSKRYVRVVGTLTGTNTNGTPIAVFAVLGRPLNVPVTQDTEVQA